MRRVHVSAKLICTPFEQSFVLFYLCALVLAIPPAPSLLLVA
jgi:hypothetical protein